MSGDGGLEKGSVLWLQLDFVGLADRDPPDHPPLCDFHVHDADGLRGMESVAFHHPFQEVFGRQGGGFDIALGVDA